MARIKKEDIKQLSTEELKARIIEEKESLTKLYFNHAISPVDNPLILRDARKNIARLKTEDRWREISPAKPTEESKKVVGEKKIVPKEIVEPKKVEPKKVESKKVESKKAETKKVTTASSKSKTEKNNPK